jgi:hypothetical protein
LSHVQWYTPIISATLEVKIGRIVVQGLPGQKVSKIPISTNNLGMFAHACQPSYMGGINRKITDQAGPGQNVRAYLKNN